MNDDAFRGVLDLWDPAFLDGLAISDCDRWSAHGGSQSTG
jgi:hypothetical protein